MQANRKRQRQSAGIYTALLTLVALGFTAGLPTRAEADNCTALLSAPIVRRTWLNWGKGKAYVFEGNKYVKYDLKSEKPDPGYPQPIAGSWGAGFWNSAPDAAVNFGNGFVYFFKGAEYIKYDVEKDAPVAGYPQKIAGNWAGLWSSGIDAAIEWKDGKLFFFKGNEYVRFDIKNDKVDPGYPLPINAAQWPGLCMNRVDGAINWGNGRAYFFRGNHYVRYDIDADKVPPGYPAAIKGAWPGLTTGSTPAAQKAAPPRNDGRKIWSAVGCELWDPPSGWNYAGKLASRSADFVKCVVANAAKEVAQAVTGEAAEVIAALKDGPEGVLTWLKKKGGGIVDKIKAIAREYEPFKTIGDLAGELLKKVGEVRQACAKQGFPKCLPDAAVAMLPEGWLKDVVKILVGPGDWGDKLKKIGARMLSMLENLINDAKKSITNLANNTLKPFLNKAKALVMEKVFDPMVSQLQNYFMSKIQGAVQPIVDRVLAKAGSIKSQAESIGAMIDEVTAGIGAKAGAAKSKLEAYEKAVSQFVKDAPKLVVDFVVEWLRDQAIPWVLEKVQSLVSSVWTWAQTSVGAVRNAAQSLVGSVPFAGGALAAAVGVAVDAGWGQLKATVEGFLGDKIKEVGAFLSGQAKQLLDGAKGNAGAFLQGILNALKGPFEKVKGMVLPLVQAALAKYSELATQVKGMRSKMQAEMAKVQALADSYKAELDAAKAKLDGMKSQVAPTPRKK